MKMEPTVSSEMSAIRTQDAGELLKKKQIAIVSVFGDQWHFTVECRTLVTCTV